MPDIVSTEVCQDRDVNPALFLFSYCLIISLNLTAEEFPFDLLAMRIRHPTEERTGRERFNLSSRHDFLFLHRYAYGVSASSYGFALTHPVKLTEHLRHGLGGFTIDLTDEGGSRSCNENIRFFFSIIPIELGYILSSDHEDDSVGTACVQDLIHSRKEDGRHLIQKHAALDLSGVIDPLEHPGGIQGDTGTVDNLPIRIIADTENLRILRVIDIQIEVITREDPVEVS